MARPLCVEFPDAKYHVTARGNERRVIFRDADGVKGVNSRHMTNLTPGQNYTYRVTNTNSTGSSPPSGTTDPTSAKPAPR